jgi:hypothetical protein
MRAYFFAVVALVGACSKSSAVDPGGVASALCAKPELQIFFSPMYTAFDGMHQFKVPAIVANVDPATITWSASDMTMLDLAPDPSVGGVMITAQKAGTAVIVANGGGACGTSQLTVTPATTDDWLVGSMRYNNGIKLVGDVVGRRPPDAGVMNDVACTNCHGDTAIAGPYKTVAHTPEQTGGFSDDDLINIFTRGRVPIGGYFDTSVVRYQTWQGFHQWQMSPQEAKGIVVYLRSLPPQSQTGMRGDFGGGGRGRGDGGGGGIMPPPPGPPGNGMGADAGTPGASLTDTNAAPGLDAAKTTD